MARLPLVVICSFSHSTHHGVLALDGLVDEECPLHTKPEHVHAQVGESLRWMAADIKKRYDRRPQWLITDGVKATQMRSVKARLPAWMTLQDIRRPLPGLKYHTVEEIPNMTYQAAEAYLVQHRVGRNDAPPEVQTALTIEGMSPHVDAITAWHIWWLAIEEVQRHAESGTFPNHTTAYDHLLDIA